MTVPIDRRLSIAPMMDRTDRHFRYLMRLISRHVLLYTEMVATGALLRGDPARALSHDPMEHPLALQLGGSEPEALARCARMAEDFGFDDVNLNLGCPSERVQAHRFGACLMAEPERVAYCLAAMRSATRLPVTVKTRLGIDDRDSYEELCRFIGTVAGAGCRTVILHARKAWPNGLCMKPPASQKAWPQRRPRPHGTPYPHALLHALYPSRRGGPQLGRPAPRDGLSRSLQAHGGTGLDPFSVLLLRPSVMLRFAQGKHPGFQGGSDGPHTRTSCSSRREATNDARRSFRQTRYLGAERGLREAHAQGREPG